MSDFEVMILGVGDAFSELHHPSSLVLICNGHLLAIDCPDMYRRVLRDFRCRSKREIHIEDIDDFLITHVHGDHINGLESVAFFKHLVLGGRVRLHAFPELLSILWDRRLAASMSTIRDGEEVVAKKFEDYFEAYVLGWDRGGSIGPFQVRLFPTRHHVPTSALLIESGGRTFGYSSDGAFDPERIAFLERADLIIHETNLGGAHTPLDRLESLPMHIKRRMRLIHHPDGFDPDASSIPALQQGDVLPVEQASGG